MLICMGDISDRTHKCAGVWAIAYTYNTMFWMYVFVVDYKVFESYFFTPCLWMGAYTKKRNKLLIQ